MTHGRPVPTAVLTNTGRPLKPTPGPRDTTKTGPSVKGVNGPWKLGPSRPLPQTHRSGNAAPPPRAALVRPAARTPATPRPLPSHTECPGPPAHTWHGPGGSPWPRLPVLCCLLGPLSPPKQASSEQQGLSLLSKRWCLAACGHRSCSGVSESPGVGQNVPPPPRATLPSPACGLSQAHVPLPHGPHVKRQKGPTEALTSRRKNGSPARRHQLHSCGGSHAHDCRGGSLACLRPVCGLGPLTCRGDGQGAAGETGLGYIHTLFGLWGGGPKL